MAKTAQRSPGRSPAKKVISAPTKTTVSIPSLKKLRCPCGAGKLCECGYNATTSRKDGEYRNALVIHPTSAHTHSVILLHGLYGTGAYFRKVPDLVRRFAGEAAAGVRYIFPTAPTR